MQHDIDTDLLVTLGLRAGLFHGLTAAEQGHATARHDPFFDRRPSGMQGVLDAGLLLLHFGLGAGTDGDDRHAAGELCQTLLQFLAVVLALRALNLSAELVHPGLHVILLAGTLDDRGLVLVNRDLLGPAEVREIEALELEPEVLRDQRAAGERGNVAEHRLAAVAEAGRLRRADVEHATELVDHKCREGVTIDILRNDQKRLAGLSHLLEQGQQVAEVGDLLLVDQDQGVVELADHLGRLVDEIGRDEPLVELHAVDEPHGRLGRLALFDRDHAVLAHPLQCLGQQVADRAIVVGADGPHLRDLLRPLHLSRDLHQPLHGRRHRLVDAAADRRRVAPGRDVARALAENRPSEHRGRGRAITGQVRRLRSHLVHELGAHVLERILEIHFLADSHAVLCDGGAAERLVDDHVAAGRPHRHRDGTGQFLDALEQLGAGVVIEQQLLGHESLLLKK